MPLETHLATLEDWTYRFLPPQKASRRLLLLLHGWTGDENSMWVFARNFPRTAWMLAPRAPFPVPSGGYSWREHVETAHSLDDLRASAAELLHFVEGWGVANQVDTDQFDVAGFSQGAAMAGMLSLLYPQRVCKLAMLAGFLPHGVEELFPASFDPEKRVFVAHGTQDLMISVERARQAVSLFEQAGAKVEYCEADVAHKVSAECLRALVDYLQD
jgi:phospholipase/carboxylesterase